MKWLVMLLLWTTAATAQDLRALRVRTFFRETAAALLPTIAIQQRQSLASALAAGSIEVVEKELIDNGGSLVDAIGVRGKVTLSQERWLSFIRENRDVRLLVLHELLRMNGQNDDGYAISRLLLPRAAANETARSYCDLRVSQTVLREVRREINGVGYAPMDNGGVFMMGRGVDNSNRDRAVEAAEADIREKCQAAGFESFGTGSGTLSFERKNVNGRKTMQFKVDMAGVCVKNAPVKRAVADQKQEGCQKISVCRDLIQDGVIGALSGEDQTALEKLERRWSCQ